MNKFEKIIKFLKCLECENNLIIIKEGFKCVKCEKYYPVLDGILYPVKS